MEPRRLRRSELRVPARLEGCAGGTRRSYRPGGIQLLLAERHRAHRFLLRPVRHGRSAQGRLPQGARAAPHRRVHLPTRLPHRRSRGAAFDRARLRFRPGIRMELRTVLHWTVVRQPAGALGQHLLPQTWKTSRSKPWPTRWTRRRPLPTTPRSRTPWASSWKAAAGSPSACLASFPSVSWIPNSTRSIWPAATCRAKPFPRRRAGTSLPVRSISTRRACSSASISSTRTISAPGSPKAPTDTLDDFFLTNVQASYRSSWFVLKLFIDNVADRRYFLFADNDVASTLGDERLIGVSLDVFYDSPA